MNHYLAFRIDDPTLVPTSKSLGTIGGIVNLIIPGIIFLAAIVFLFMLIMGAFQWITAGDKAENVSKAQKTLVFAVLGIIIIAVSYIAIKVLGVVFNFSDQITF